MIIPWNGKTFEKNLNTKDVGDFLDHVRKADARQVSGRFLAAALAKAAGCGFLEALQDLAVVRGLPPGPAVSSAAAGKGHLDILQWIFGQRPPDDYEISTCLIAAADAGHEPVSVWLHQQYPACFKGTYPGLEAAQQGSLKALVFLSTADPPCLPFDLVCQVACGSGQWHLVEWLLCQTAADSEFIAMIAVANGSLHILSMLQSLSPRVKIGAAAIYTAARNGDMQALLLLKEEIKELHEASFVQLCLSLFLGSNFKKLTQPDHDRHPRAPRQPPFRADHAGALEWLLDLRHCDISNSWAKVFNDFTESSCSILPIQLAAKCHHRIPWSGLTHSRAAAWGDLALLRWLTSEPVAADQKTVHEDCSNGRMLLLVHGHGWILPGSMTQRLDAAEQCHFALLSIVQQLRCQASAETDIGKLPDAIIKKIGCMADVDFSWTFSS